LQEEISAMPDVDKFKILLVEENKIARKVLEGELGILEASIEILTDGRKTIATVAGTRPDVIVLASDLSNMTEHQICAELKKHNDTKDIPVIIVSHTPTESDRKNAYGAGADYFCKSPFPRGMLAKKIQSFLEKKDEKVIPQKFLVAEDSDTIRSIIVNILQKQGHTVVEAKDGMEAWDILNEQKDIDLIISDISMPNMDGYQLCRLIRGTQDLEFIPIIIASTISDKNNIAKLLNSGADDYLIKPFSEEEFLARIKAHTRVHQLYAELRVANENLKKFNDSLERMVSFRTQELYEANMESITMLAVASEHRDTDTGNHVRRIADYCHQITFGMGYSESKADEIRYSAILHDVGKIAIPDSILKKPGNLSESEARLMQNHTVKGEEILSGTQFFKTAREIARWHHEKFDGSGYPDRLEEYSIPLPARITSVADVFDALTTKRVYKDAWKEKDAHEYIIKLSGKDFDPMVVDAFDKLFQEGVISKIRNKYS